MKNSTTEKRPGPARGIGVAARCRLLCLLSLLAPAVLFAQPTRITGSVANENGEAIAGATIIVRGTQQGTTTDGNGSFALDIPADGATLTVSFIGYATREVAVSSQRTEVRIVLQADMIAVDEVVVVGYGEQLRRTVTSSVAKLDGDALQNLPISNASEGLKGKIAGLRVTQTNFTPGGEFTYQIRGGSSINGTNAPLVLVDGVERDFSAINPNDIASIEVLKDAASSAIYGAKSSNGIILVTTRRGGYNKAPRITFEANWAYQNTETEIEFLNAREYIQVVRSAVAEYLNGPSKGSSEALSYLNGQHSAGIGNKPGGKFSTRYYNPETDVLPAGYQTMPDPVDPSRTIMFRDTDWQDLLYNGAWWQNYYLGIDGGGERVRYSASLGYTNDQGVALSTGYDRMNFKSNLDAKITRRLTASFGVDFARTNTEAYANQRNTISRALANPPTMNAYYDDGSPVEGYNSSSLTPLFYDKYYERSNQKNYLSLIGGLKWEIVDGLTANAHGSFFRTDTKAKQFIKANVYDATRKSSWSQNLTERMKFEAFLSYRKTFAEQHNLSIMGGYSYQRRDYEAVKLAGYGGTSDKVTTINGSASFDADDISTSEQAECQIGFFGRLNYDYKGKYLLTATFREDGSSKFAKSNRWGFFPGISGGWVLTEEPWLDGVRRLDFLKLRASYGSTGNNASVGIYDAYGSYGAGYMYNGNAGIKPSEMPNEKLQWGDLRPAGHRFRGGPVRQPHLRQRRLLRQAHAQPALRAAAPQYDRILEVLDQSGQGAFLGLRGGAHHAQHREEELQLGLEARVELPMEQGAQAALQRHRQEPHGRHRARRRHLLRRHRRGRTLNRFYGYIATGIIETEEQAANAYYDSKSRNPQVGGKRVGDYEWADRNGDGQITDADRFCLGTTVPPFTGGLSNTFRLKNWTLSVYLDWAMGHSIFDESYSRYFYGTFTNNYALAKDVLKAWKNPATGPSTPSSGPTTPTGATTTTTAPRPTSSPTRATTSASARSRSSTRCPPGSSRRWASKG